MFAAVHGVVGELSLFNRRGLPIDRFQEGTWPSRKGHWRLKRLSSTVAFGIQGKPSVQRQFFWFVEAILQPIHALGSSPTNPRKECQR
jgi:hypothetical protein